MILDSIHSPEDIRALDQNQLPQLCKELRQFLLENVSKTGGHFSSNLGVVELTVAIHRVFDTAHDRLVFDVGHQAYVHKALTGRQALFSTLRQLDGLSGFPSPTKASMTPSSRATPPTPFPWRWAWRGRGPCSTRIIRSWR